MTRQSEAQYAKRASAAPACLHNLVGEIWVVRDRQGGGPIRDLRAMACPWPAGCVGVRTSGLSEAETGREPKVSPANACWPAFSLRDWRLLSPGVWGDGSLCRLGGSLGSLGAPCPPASAPPGRVPLCRGWPLRDPASSALGTG